MISFDPSEDQQLIIETVADLAKTTLAPRARDFERERGVSEDVRKTIQEMSLALAAAPEDVGGQGLGLLGAVLINEELAYGDPAAPFGLPGFGAFTLAALELGTAAQAKELLAPLADPEAHSAFGAVAWSEDGPCRERAGFSTVAKETPGGWTLTGKKCFVSNSHQSESFIVFAQVDETKGWRGIGAFVVSKSDAGVVLGERHETLGLDVACYGAVSFENARATMRLEGGTDFSAACLRFWVKYSLTVAARQVGLARMAFDVAREYCDIRQAFGKPIGHFQAVAFNLADRHMDADTAQDLVRRAAWSWDGGKNEKRALLHTAQAVAQAHEVAMRCANDSVQLHGGAGFMRDVVVEKLMRDAKQMALAGCTAEQMDQLASAIELGAELDPALVLPTPETQAIFT